jgi:hypothetical protein
MVKQAAAAGAFWLVVLVLCGPSAGGRPATDPVSGDGPQGAIEQLRRRLGVTDVMTIEVTGTARRLVGTTLSGQEATLSPFKLLIRWDASGRYLRTETIDMSEGAVQFRAGFDGGTLLNGVRAIGGVQLNAAYRADSEQLTIERRNARRFALAVLLRTDGATPEPLPGEGSYAVRFGDSIFDRVELVTDPAAGLPRTLRFNVMARRSPADSDREVARELHLESYRRFGRARLPSALATYEGSRLIEVIEIDEARVNVAFGPGAFDR